MNPVKYNRLFIFFILALAGCDEGENENVKPTVEKYAMLEMVSGDNQSGVTGQFLKDSIVIKVTPKNSSLKPDRFYVKAKMAKGNGYLTELYYSEVKFLGTNGKLRTIWSLGCDVMDQRVTFYLYNYDSCQYNRIPTPVCTPIDSITFHATSSTPAGWNRACGIVDPDYATKFKTYNGILYAVNRGSLYKAVRQDALWWEKIKGLPVNDVVDFDFNSTGKVYIVSEDQGVFSSSDLKNWTSMSSGLLDPRYPMTLLVEDSVVYVSYLFDGLYRLRSGSTFWKKLLIDGRYNEEYEFATRHPNGKLYLTDKWSSVWVSENSGDSWTNTQISYLYKHGEVTDFKIHPNGQIYIGSYDATLSILDPDTYTGNVFTYYEWNASSQLINNITFRNDGVYYLVNHTPNAGIYSSASAYQKFDIGVDDRFDKFVFDSQNRVLITKFDGVYYKKD